MATPTSPSLMAEPVYTIFCAVQDEWNPFSVKIAKTETVDELKVLIKARLNKRYEDIAAHELRLHKVNVDLTNTPREEWIEKLKKESQSMGAGSELDPFDPLGQIYSTNPTNHPEKVIHILAKLPDEYRPKTPENLRNLKAKDDLSPPSPEKDWIVSTEKNLRVKFKYYLDNDVQLPLWQPNSGPYQSHITELKLPVLFQHSPGPSLLLHNLGSTSHDPSLAQRIETLFSENTKLRFLCNTSGAGKTRLLLEGLWRRWGFYITARDAPDAIGSSDLSFALGKLQKYLRILTNEHDTVTLEDNRKIAERIFSMLLFVRLLVFRIYLETATLQSGGLAEKHKGKWLLLQVAPFSVLGQDPFKDLVTRLWKMPQENVEAGIAEEQRQLTRLTVEQQNLFFVLDEGQIPANLYQDYFLDSLGQAKRPILREIISVWAEAFPRMIISGTGMSMQQVATVLGSLVSKIPEGPLVVTDLGAFDTEVAHRKYLELYLPQEMLDHSLFSMLHYWLRGRHRFTATYLHSLIKTNFDNPIAVLNQYVVDMTAYRILPSIEVPNAGLPISFDFSSLSAACNRDPPLLGILGSFAWEYVFTGKIRGLGGRDGEKMVEYGISRFQRGDIHDRAAEMDEPIAILALLTYLSNKEHTLERYLTDTLNVPNPSSRGFAFEPFCAFVIARAFASPRRLSEVFSFVGDPAIKDDVAELVALRIQDGTFIQEPLNIDSNSRSNHLLGKSPSTVTKTLKWLEDPKGTTFCFPHNDVGPDLIFVLRLTKDMSIIPVCVQCKNTQQLAPAQTTAAINTTDPSLLVSRKSNEQLKLREDMEAAILRLSGDSGLANSIGALRVLISYPALPDQTKLMEVSQANNNHPVATINLDTLLKQLPAGSPSEKILYQLGSSLVRSERKRKRDHTTNYMDVLPTSSLKGSSFSSKIIKKQKTGEELAVGNDSGSDSSMAEFNWHDNQSSIQL